MQCAFVSLNGGSVLNVFKLEGDIRFRISKAPQEQSRTSIRWKELELLILPIRDKSTLLVRRRRRTAIWVLTHRHLAVFIAMMLRPFKRPQFGCTASSATRNGLGHTLETFWAVRCQNRRKWNLLHSDWMKFLAWKTLMPSLLRMQIEKTPSF